MLERIRKTIEGYPRQFWLLFFGGLLSSAGSSMVWPFLTLYLRQRLNVPLTDIAMLFTLNAVAGLPGVFSAGAVADRFGRKGVMVVGMATNSLFFIGMSLAGTMQSWTLMMVLSGIVGPLFSVGSSAMVVDLVETKRRPNAYALLRMVQNLGITIGPAVGGFIAVNSYTLLFYIAAAATGAFSLIILLFVKETLPKTSAGPGEPAAAAASPVLHPAGGYLSILRDWPFLSFCLFYTLSGFGYIIFMVLLPVYAKENFAVLENQFGLIMSTNALMVVALQYSVTNLTKRYAHIPVLAIGSLFYALGVGSVILGRSFPAFLASMVVLTFGEMIMVPTSTVLTAELAPVDMRGRYMSIYSITWGAGLGIGPLIGGALNDNIGPIAIWYGAALFDLIAFAGFIFLALALRNRLSKKALEIPAA
jgi:MFS family permease